MSDIHWPRFNLRILTVLLLGFSSGLPLALTGSTLQAWFTESGVSLATIGVLSLVGMPYVWKFLWSPLMDRFVPPWWGRRRGWISFMQIALCISLIVLANQDPVASPILMGVLALLIAFLSASQDIAIDAYRTDILLREERGIGAACAIFSYRMAMLFSGGFALILADHIGWRLTYEGIAFLIALLTIATYFAPESKVKVSAPATFSAAVIKPFQNLLKRDAIMLILLFVVLYKVGDALALALMSNFLLHGLGFSLTDVGLAYKTMGILGTLMGAFLGGALLTRLSLYWSLLIFGTAQAFSNLMFMVLAAVGKNYLLMVASLFIESFCSGMSTAALMAFFMALCHQEYSATQYACLTALSAIGRVLLGPLAAGMVAKLGWVQFYFWTFALCFPSLFLLKWIRHRLNDHDTLFD